MSQFPTDSEVRHYLWQWLAGAAKGSYKAGFKFYELQQGIVSILETHGYNGAITRGNLNWRLSQFVLEQVSFGIICPDMDAGSISWSRFNFTEHGRTALNTTSVSCYDLDGYIDLLKKQSNNPDGVIIQYTTEAILCFRRGIHFACAVMIGAAAEKAILLLLDAIIESKQDVNEQGKLRKIYVNPNLPRIFDVIQKTLEPLTANNGSIDYPTHQGSTQHLLSLFEMIRVQRNDSVHPTTPANGSVDMVKLMLSLNSFPIALGVIYRLTDWFSARKGIL